MGHFRDIFAKPPCIYDYSSTVNKNSVFCVTGECVCEDSKGVRGIDCPSNGNDLCPKTCEYHELHKATSEGYKKCVHYQVHEWADVNQVVNGTSVLYQAVSSGDVGLVKAIVVNPIQNATLDFKSTINCTDCDRQGDAPLHQSVKKKFDQITALLIEIGANVAVENEFHENSQPIHEAGKTVGGTPRAIELLVNGGADINAKDATNTTSLIYACSNGLRNIVQASVSKFGANVNIRNEEGFTALNQAKISDSIEDNPRNSIESFLSGRGATENGTCTCEDGTPFDQVACPIDKEDYCQSCDSTSLEAAIDNALLECTVYRIEEGDDVNGLINGMTPLHLAVSGKYRVVFKNVVFRG